MTALASSRRRLKCPVCDRAVERQSRTQVYCSARCMRKANYARKAGLGQLSGHYTALVPTPHKSSNENNVLQWPKSGSSISCNGPISLVGGGSWKWPGAGHLDSKTLAKIRWCEVGGELQLPAEEGA